ncbi:hypothetical protein [Streptomyces sp. NPDC001250]|uniref:hypothetical protein n=1 Tax=Streptomyces sp. NPDC001250 TaxID=3154382 RepID=UPI00331B72BB
MTTSNHPESPIRRRRHAHLIATLTKLIGDCADAASGVYGPIAEAPPTQANVSVNLGPLAGLCVSASTRLDRARSQDAARWPTAVAKEMEDDVRTFAARCAAAEAERVLLEAGDSKDSDFRGPSGAIPLLAVPQAAALAVADAAADFLTDLLDDPAQAIKRVREMASTGEFTVDQILDEAADTAALSGLLSLHKAQLDSDPSTAAEDCLTASRHFALAVSMASAEVEEATP